MKRSVAAKLSAELDSVISREQWMLAQHLSAVVAACDAPFCLRDFASEETPRDGDYVDHVATQVAQVCSVSMLENTIVMLKRARKIKQALMRIGQKSVKKAKKENQAILDAMFADAKEAAEAAATDLNAGDGDSGK